MSALQIDRAAAGSGAILSALAQKTFYDTYSALVPNRLGPIKAYTEVELAADKIEAELKNENIFYFFLRTEGENIGYAKIAFDPPPEGLSQSPSLHLDRFYLLRSWQRSGVGKTFLSFVQTFAKEHAFRSLWLRVFDGNEASIRFHEGLGFKQIKKMEWRFTWDGVDYIDNDILFELELA